MLTLNVRILLRKSTTDSKGLLLNYTLGGPSDLCVDDLLNSCFILLLIQCTIYDIQVVFKDLPLIVSTLVVPSLH